MGCLKGGNGHSKVRAFVDIISLNGDFSITKW